MKLIEAQIKQCEMYINYWLTLAANPAADTREIYRYEEDNHGRQRVRLTPVELQQDAMQTAHRHIRRMGDLIDALPGETK